jgi:hypothetical protein
MTVMKACAAISGNTNWTITHQMVSVVLKLVMPCGLLFTWLSLLQRSIGLR